MKNIGIGIGIIFLFIISLLTIFSIDTKKIRADELERSTSNSLSRNLEKKNYDNVEIKSNIENSIVRQISSKSILQIDYLVVDKKLGIISIGVKESYKNPNGHISTIYNKKCVIVDQHKKEDVKKEKCLVVFYDGTTVLNKLIAEKGMKICLPINLRLYNWKDENGNLINENFIINEDIKLYK